MKEIIRKLLQNLIDDFDAGNTNIDEEEAIKIAGILSEFRKDNGISKYAACKYLNISRATFDRLVLEGKLPKGEHKQGFKELFWYKKDLDSCLLKMKKCTE